LISYEPGYEYPCRFNILIDLNTFDSWILGDNALRGVLLTYDLQEKMISFIKTNVPANITVEDNNDRGYIYYLIGILFVAILLYCLYKCFYVSDEAKVHDEKAYQLLDNKNV